MIVGIALKNIFRHKKRTALTSMIIIIGAIMVILFSGASSALKKIMVAQITDSMIGHIQIHKKGYMANVDTQPLDMVIKPQLESKIMKDLKEIKEIEVIGKRLKFTGMVSNYDKSVAMKVTAVEPDKEALISPDLAGRIDGINNFKDLKSGEIVLSSLIANNMKLKKGDEIVFIATNAEGSVNGMSFIVAGIIDLVIGPEGKNGYMTIEDAKSLLRMDEDLEIAIRVNDLKNVDKVGKEIEVMAAKDLVDKNGKVAIEIHKWTELTNFTSILTIIDVMSVSLKVILIFIVLFSILNIMMMAVFERVKEIGTIAAMGTKPNTIISIFMWEGLFLGLLSSLVGSIVGLGINYFISFMNIEYKFARSILILKPEISMVEIGILIVVITFIAVIASFFPALKAAKMEPVDALRN